MCVGVACNAFYQLLRLKLARTYTADFQKVSQTTHYYYYYYYYYYFPASKVNVLIMLSSAKQRFCEEITLLLSQCVVVLY